MVQKLETTGKIWKDYYFSEDKRFFPEGFYFDNVNFEIDGLSADFWDIMSLINDHSIVHLIDGDVCMESEGPLNGECMKKHFKNWLKHQKYEQEQKETQRDAERFRYLKNFIYEDTLIGGWALTLAQKGNKTFEETIDEGIAEKNGSNMKQATK